MPTLLRLNGYRFYFFSHEPNEPPHVHIDKGDATIKVGWRVWKSSSAGAFARTRLVA